MCRAKEHLYFFYILVAKGGVMMKTLHGHCTETLQDGALINRVFRIMCPFAGRLAQEWPPRPPRLKHTGDVMKGFAASSPTQSAKKREPSSACACAWPRKSARPAKEKEADGRHNAGAHVQGPQYTQLMPIVAGKNVLELDEGKDGGRGEKRAGHHGRAPGDVPAYR